MTKVMNPISDLTIAFISVIEIGQRVVADLTVAQAQNYNR